MWRQNPPNGWRVKICGSRHVQCRMVAKKRVVIYNREQRAIAIGQWLSVGFAYWATTMFVFMHLTCNQLVIRQSFMWKNLVVLAVYSLTSINCFLSVWMFLFHASWRETLSISVRVMVALVKHTWISLTYPFSKLIWQFICGSQWMFMIKMSNPAEPKLPHNKSVLDFTCYNHFNTFLFAIGKCLPKESPWISMTTSDHVRHVRCCVGWGGCCETACLLLVEIDRSKP